MKHVEVFDREVKELPKLMAEDPTQAWEATNSYAMLSIARNLAILVDEVKRQTRRDKIRVL